MRPLEDYHEDESWKPFAEALLNDPVRGVREPGLEAKLGASNAEAAEAIAVACAILGSGTIRGGWLDSRFEMLDFETPRNCLNDPKLIRRLREFLMRAMEWL